MCYMEISLQTLPALVSRHSSHASVTSNRSPLSSISVDESAAERMYVVVMDYYKQRGDEVDLKKGEMVDVLQKDFSGQYRYHFINLLIWCVDVYRTGISAVCTGM